MTNRIKMGAVALSCGLLGAAHPASAVDWSISETRVTAVEATYLPNAVVFKIDKPAGTCAKGALLFYTPQGDTVEKQIANANGVMSMLITAKISGQTVTVTGVSSGCVVQYLTME
jgi:hypothetical protein